MYNQSSFVFAVHELIRERHSRIHENTFIIIHKLSFFVLPSLDCHYQYHHLFPYLSFIFSCCHYLRYHHYIIITILSSLFPSIFHLFISSLFISSLSHHYVLSVTSKLQLISSFSAVCMEGKLVQGTTKDDHTHKETSRGVHMTALTHYQ